MHELSGQARAIFGCARLVPDHTLGNIEILAVGRRVEERMNNWLERAPAEAMVAMTVSL